MKKTAPHGVRPVLMGPFREIRTKKTAPGGSVKDEEDRATWCGSGADGSLYRNKDEKDRATWIC